MESRLERRVVDLGAMGAEVRVQDENGISKIVGHFAVYNRFSPTYGKFRERIAPGFFDKSIAQDDIRALFNHNEDYVLGRTKSGTLRLNSDSVGLFGEIDVPDSAILRGLVVDQIRRGDISGASFSFTLAEGGDVWKKGADGVMERTLIEANQVFDVGPVTNPFYPDTAVGLRSLFGLESAEESLDRWLSAERRGAGWIDIAKRRLELMGVE